MPWGAWLQCRAGGVEASVLVRGCTPHDHTRRQFVFPVGWCTSRRRACWRYTSALSLPIGSQQDLFLSRWLSFHASSWKICSSCPPRPSYCGGRKVPSIQVCTCASYESRFRSHVKPFSLSLSSFGATVTTCSYSQRRAYPFRCSTCRLFPEQAWHASSVESQLFGWTDCLASPSRVFVAGRGLLSEEIPELYPTLLLCFFSLATTHAPAPPPASRKATRHWLCSR